MTSLLTLVVVALLSVGGPAGASAAVPSSDSPSAEAAAHLREHPGGTLVTSHHVVYPDGSGFVAEDAGTLSLNQCGSGRFCTWTSANYTGSFFYVTGTGVTRQLPGTVRSFWNNRRQAARLYNNSGGASTCHGAGVKKSSLAVAYQSPAKVFLSSGTGC